MTSTNAPPTQDTAKRSSVFAPVIALLLLLAALVGGLVVGAPYCATATWDLSRKVPGDERAFQPFTHLAALAEYAGPGARLVQAHATGVRADGTIDLTADDGSGLQYRFVLPDGEQPGHIRYVNVDVWDPGELRSHHAQGGGCQDSVTYRHLGMERRALSAPQPGTVDATLPSPSCDPAKLVDEARKRASADDADAVAHIRWDASTNVTEVWLDGTDVKVVVDGTCAPH